MMIRILLITLVVSLLASPARAQVDSFPIFLGEARDDTGQAIPGSLAFIVRIVSTSGPIQAVDFANGFDTTTGAPRGILGNMCQRWTSSQNNFVYDQTTPGFYPDVNNQSVLSFDSHFLTQPGVIDVTTAPVESGVLFPFGHPFPSTSGVGYGIGVPSFHNLRGFLKTAWNIPPSAQSAEVDAAYVVAGGSVAVFGQVLTSTGWHDFQWGTGVPQLPEPSMLLFAAGILLLTCRAR